MIEDDDAAFDALFENFRQTAFRYEGMPAYDVTEEVEQIQAWREGRPRPERSVRTDPWLARIAADTAANKKWSRVRAVDWPLPEYLQFEVVGYVESQAAGEEIRLIDRSQSVPALDFWLFDRDLPNVAAVQLHYTPTGEWRGFELIRDRGVLRQLEGIAEQVITASLPLNVWLADRFQGPRVA